MQANNFKANQGRGVGSLFASLLFKSALKGPPKLNKIILMLLELQFFIINNTSNIINLYIVYCLLKIKNNNLHKKLIYY